MTERQLATKVIKQLKDEFPQYIWYKPGDTFGGHKKPGDLIAFIENKFVIVEFKIENSKLNENQLDWLNYITSRKGVYLVCRFYNKNILIDGPAHKQVTIEYKKGRYEKLEKLIYVVENFYK